MDAHIFVQLVVNGLLVGGVYGLMSLGINLVWGVMGVINLAHGDLIMAAGFLTFWIFSHLGANPLLVLPVGMAMAFTVGALSQRFLLGRLPQDRGAVKSSLLMTFGISYMVINTAQLLWGNEFQTVAFLAGSWKVAGLDFAKGRAVAFLAAGAVTLILWAFLQFTNAGRAVRAVSQNPDGACSCGIDIARIRIFSFGLGASLAGAAGVLLVMIFAISPAMGSGYTIRAFAVTVIGGLGSFPGALLGAVILGLAEVFAGYLVSAQVANGVAFILFLIVLLALPQGLMGRR
ncbi:MAG TPA: branched-chain amino acid ABC transporter permease [Candidatus Methylomirabilis sp.]|nr:branched-chain amino acid ABC transporter permease [Candidatus Methylomirabilis sp.]